MQIEPEDRFLSASLLVVKTTLFALLVCLIVAVIWPFLFFIYQSLFSTVNLNLIENNISENTFRILMLAVFSGTIIRKLRKNKYGHE